MSKPRYADVRDMASAWERASAGASDTQQGRRNSEPAVAPTFATGAIDLLRERVARMRESIAVVPPPAPAEWQDDGVESGHDDWQQPLENDSHAISAAPAGRSEQEARAWGPDYWAPNSGTPDSWTPDFQKDFARDEAPAGLGGELAAIRASLHRLGGAEHSVLLAEAVAALGRKIDLLNAKALDPVSLRRLELQTTELRGAVERALRLREASDARAEAAYAPIAEATQDIHAATRAAAESQERMEREMSALHARLHRLSGEIGSLPEEFSTALADQVALLLDRIEGGPGMDATALAPLVDVIERHLVALTERLVASQARLERLDGIEETLHRISGQMEDLQYASADVSAEAVQAVALRLSARDDAPAVVGLKRGLAALEARQREFELRTEDYLVRELELELQDLADLEMARPPRRHEGEAGFSADLVMPVMDLDRRIFDGALGDHTVVPERTVRTDWVAAAARSEVRDETVRKGRRKGHLLLAGRAAVVAAAVGLAGVTVLQIARPTTSYARANAGAPMVAAKALAAAPVQTADASRLPAPVGGSALRTAALAGDPAAAYEVGVRFADGKGTEANTASAIKWLSFATARGSIPAAYRLGSIYEYSERNSAEARRLYTWAAERGNLRAMHNLGVMATEGVDGRPDWQSALKWFRQAAEAGLRDSQHNLGVIYARGLAGQADMMEAFKWFAVAAAQGDTGSGRKRDEVARKFDPATLNRAQGIAATFAPSASNKAANMVVAKPEWDAATEASAQPTTSGT